MRFLDVQNYEEVIEYITDGKDDHSIDAFHIDSQEEDVCRVSIFQMKYRSY